MEEIIILILIGAVFGYIGGYAGIGGAPLLIACLVIIFGTSQYTAQGTILAVMLGPMSLLGVLVLRDRVKLLLRYIILGVITYAFFSYFGAVGAFFVGELSLKLLFVVLLIILGIVDIYSSSKHDKIAIPLHKNKISIAKNPYIIFNYLSVSVVGSVVGIFGGFFGIGAGVLMVPIFTNLFKLHKDDARALSLAILLPPVSIGAVIKYYNADSINWLWALVIFLAYFSTNLFGTKQGTKHSFRKFKLYFGIIMILMGVSYIFLINNQF
jgi:uncharacterized membrane protein YfcA